jgi:hypothetical protein
VFRKTSQARCCCGSRCSKHLYPGTVADAALCRDGGSRAGTPFAWDEATDGSALDVAQLQGLLADAGASDRAPFSKIS